MQLIELKRAREEDDETHQIRSLAEVVSVSFLKGHSMSASIQGLLPPC